MACSVEEMTAQVTKLENDIDYLDVNETDQSKKYEDLIHGVNLANMGTCLTDGTTVDNKGYFEENNLHEPKETDATLHASEMPYTRLENIANIEVGQNGMESDRNERDAQNSVSASEDTNESDSSETEDDIEQIYPEPDDKDSVSEQIEADINLCAWEKTLFEANVESLDCDMCSVEGETTPACFYCFDCEIYLCEGCQKWHKKLESSVNHFCMHKDEIMGKIQMESKPVIDKNKQTNGWDPNLFDQAEVTIDRISVCGPCVYGGKHVRAHSVCLDCLEFMCSSCNNSHLGVTSHKIISMTEWHEKDVLKEVVPVYKDNCYKDSTQRRPDVKTTLERRFDSRLTWDRLCVLTVKEHFERVAPGTIQRQSSLPKIEDKRYYHVNSFSTRVFEDLQYPQVTGITFTWDGRILVCDRNNEKLKLFSQELKPLASLEIPKPADVTIIDKITAVCSLPDNLQLAFVDIKNGLKLLKYIDTSVKYWGLDYLNHELFALTIPDKSTPSCVHMLDIAGHVISIIYPSTSLADRSVAKYPKYLTVSPSGGTLYVTDTNNRVIALGLDGRLIFEHDSEEIRSVNGLVTDDRNVYVCMEEACCLLRVTLDGGSSSVALGHKDHLDSPCCVAMDTTHTKMIISELHTSIVQVYEV